MRDQGTRPTVTISSIRATLVAGNIELEVVHAGGIVRDGIPTIEGADVIDAIEAMLRLRPDLAAKVQEIAARIREDTGL